MVEGLVLWALLEDKVSDENDTQSSDHSTEARKKKSGVTRADSFADSETVRSYRQVLVLCQVYGIE